MNLTQYRDYLLETADDIGDRLDALVNGIAGFKSGISGGIKAMPTVAEIASWMPANKKGHADCHDSVRYITNLTELFPTNQGALAMPLIISADPVNGAHFLTTQPLTVIDNSTVKISIERGTRLESALKTCTHRLPVAICLGVDPTLAFVASAPVPANLNPFSVAGFLKKGHFNLVQCFTQELNVPEDSDFIIEGYIQKSDEMRLFHASCLTHRKNAVYSTETADFTPALEKIALKFLKVTILPQITDLHLPDSSQKTASVKIKEFAGRSIDSIANTLWGCGIPGDTSTMLITDKETDIRSEANVEKIISECKDKKNYIVQRQGESEKICYFDVK